jgi:hypothetical protein
VSVATIDDLPGVRPVVEMGVGSIYDDASTARWDVAQWDDTTDAHWAGDQPMWLDITCHVMDVQGQVGRERSLDAFDVGTATITCENNDGWADYPTSIPDLEDDTTFLAIRPGRSMRVGVALDDASPVFLFAGYIDAANPSYDTDGATMTFHCVDALGDAGRAELAKLAAAVGASETVTNRIVRILNAASWPGYRRALDVSGVAVRATTLGASCVNLLQRAAESAGGQVYGDLGSDTRDPSVAFRGRDWASYDHDDEPLGTIGNYRYAGSGDQVIPVTLTESPPGSGLYLPGVVPVDEDPDGSGLLQVVGTTYGTQEDPPDSGLLLAGERVDGTPPDTCPTSWELSFEREDITTQATLGRQGEVPHVYTDRTGGVSLFGIEPWAVGDLETDVDAELNWLGARVLATRNWRFMPRINAVTLVAAGDRPEVARTMLQASPFLPARFRCQHRYGSRVVFNRVMMVTGVRFNITPQEWVTRLSLDDATPYLVGGTTPAHWDEAGVALWDTATWSAPV